MSIFHSEYFLSCYSCHDIPAYSFGLPEVELGCLIVRDVSIFDEVVTVPIPLFGVGDFDSVELNINLEALVMWVVQLVPKYLFTLPDNTRLLLSLSVLFGEVEVQLV